MPGPRTSQRLAIAIATLAILASACGGAATPAGSTDPGPGASGSPGASASAAGGPAPAGVTLVEFAETADVAAGAAREQQLSDELRASLGLPDMLGPDGVTAMADLDALEAAFAASLLRDAATAVDTGVFPEGASSDPLAGQMAALGSGAAAIRTAPGAIDISLFAETGFTTTALMSLFVGLVERAGQSGEGTISRSEPHEQTSGGLRQQVTVTTTMSIRTGGGRVSADITLTATDNIFKADGTFVALYTSTSNGHFDVSACPDERGNAEGTYTFETKHELNDVSATTAARSGGGRSVEAPFVLVDGPDAKLKEIQATLDLAADGRGPGTDGNAAVDWAASQVLQVVLPRGGTTTGSGGPATVTGSGGESASGAMALSSALAQLFIGQVGTAAESFWRSGKCMEVVTSEESRTVDPGEQVDLEISRVKHLFQPGDVDEPVTFRFSGKEHIDPAPGTPLDLSTTLTFKAGNEPRDKGTLDIEQVSVRGIARKTVEFTVQPADLWITIDGRIDIPGANLSLSTGEWKLEKTERGFEQTITGEVSGSVEALGCSKSVTDELPMRVIAVPDEADPDLIRLYVAPTLVDIDHEETITCQGVTTKAFVPTIDFVTPFLGTEGWVPVRVDETTTLRDAAPDVVATVTLRRQETDT